jgi:two-component system NtrC family sensor kinase
MAALGKMATGIAHEINNPLAVIGEKAGWMKDLLEEEQFQKSDNLREFETSISKIEDHVERARKITHSMLGFARRMEPRLDDVDINRVLNQMVELLHNYARINNIEIRRSFAADLPVISSDQAQLQQVFLNLINNAIDAIGENGWIEINTATENSDVVIRITDNGPGISEENLKRVFDPFFTTKQPGSGTGLGLSIIYGIVENMKGSIKLESKEGKGTTAVVKLPIILPEKK